MIAKALLLLCALSAATSSDVDSILEQIFGSTEASASTPEPTVTTYTPCTTDPMSFGGSKPGECVPYYMCQFKEDPSTQGPFYIHINVEQPCDSYIDVCCAADDRVSLTTQSDTKASEAP